MVVRTPLIVTLYLQWLSRHVPHHRCETEFPYDRLKLLDSSHVQPYCVMTKSIVHEAVHALFNVAFADFV